MTGDPFSEIRLDKFILICYNGERMKIETIDKETVLLVSHYVDLYFEHPAKAHQFYLEHQEVIDAVFEWHEKTKKDWEREQAVQNWMEMKNQ